MGRSRAWIGPIALYLLGIGVAIAGSQIQGDDAATYRLLRSVPGLVDVCGDYTWVARAVPPLLAAIGVVLSSLSRLRTIVKIILLSIGTVLTITAGVAVYQNAVPIGVQDCIVDPPLTE